MENSRLPGFNQVLLDYGGLNSIRGFKAGLAPRLPATTSRLLSVPGEGEDRNRNMTEAGNLGLEELVKLARDKSRKSRSVLFAAINDLYSGEENFLTEQDRTIMVDIIRRLVGEVEVSVRRTLAERLAERPDAPRDLVVTLANDEIDPSDLSQERSAPRPRTDRDRPAPDHGTSGRRRHAAEYQ